MKCKCWIQSYSFCFSTADFLVLSLNDLRLRRIDNIEGTQEAQLAVHAVDTRDGHKTITVNVRVGSFIAAAYTHTMGALNNMLTF